MTAATFTVPIYQRKRGDRVDLVTLGLGASTRMRSANGIHKAQEQLVDDLRRVVEATAPAELGRFSLKRGTRLERVRVEVSIKDGKRRKVSGLCPLIVEPRPAGSGRTFYVAYHPLRQAEWFPTNEQTLLGERATAYFASAWADLDDDEIASLFAENAKDSLRVVSFDARPKALLDELPRVKKGVWDDLEVDPARAQKRRTVSLTLLPTLATDLTVKATAVATGLGLPRSPYREQLQVLLGGERKQPTILVGAPGAGKTTVLRRLVHDLLEGDGYATHKNLDKVTHVWRIGGKQLIAGMSRVGEWEQRCVELLDECRGRRIVLYVTDLHLWGRIGRARDSTRALADFFRGPLARGEIAMVAECTPEQVRRLEEDAPSFAAPFVRLFVDAATRDETFRMMLARARDIEAERDVKIQPMTYETIIALSNAVYPAQCFPGKALDMLARIADGWTGPIDSGDVLAYVARDTGLPRVLTDAAETLPAAAVEAALALKVIGQPVAVREAADLVVRMKAGVSDPGRPLGVFFFTGPTGTGKTELAKALADYLYGSASRLVRFDMSEMSGPDAVARLIGDAWAPEGALVRAALTQPFCVVLLDEIEKAHPAVTNLLLQLFDDGRLTDAAGNTASFTQAVIVMTSNLGARRQAPVGFEEAPDGLMLDVARAVREFFPPELFNRIDAVVPFRPLAHDEAVEVTKKGLSKMFGRTGFVERNVFARVDEATVEEIARRALRAEDGARSLKRFIEDGVGSLLAAEIAKAPSGAMHVMHVEHHDGALRVDVDRLVEAKPVARSYALESLWTKPLQELRERLPEADQRLEAIERSERLAALSERLRHHLSEHNRGARDHGEALYDLESMRASVQRLRERIEQLMTASRDLQHDAIERALEDTLLRPRERAFAMQGTRAQIFDVIAETFILERALSKVDDVGQHAVHIALEPLGASRRLVEELGWACATARGEVDAFVAVTRDRVRVDVGRNALGTELAGKPDFVAWKQVGFCVRDFFELETGTHVRKALADEPELLRVTVTPARHSDQPRALADAFIDARARARGSRLLPTVRSVHLDAGRTSGEPLEIEIEDYVMGLSHVVRARSLCDALRPLWLLRVSREEA